MKSLQKSIVIYIDEDIAVFLKKKLDNGFKISSFVRFLILEEIQKEQEDGKDGSK
jgi:hypothetical protein